MAGLKQYYGNSQCMEMVCNLLDTFSKINDKKYRSDLDSFIRESQLADFAFQDQNEIIVSTMHKAKGHEFDCVYMLLNSPDITDNERKRAFYVGMTRAKTELYLHYNNHAFDRFATKITDDTVLYPEPKQIMLQLTHRDVVLSFFMDKKKQILRLRSGDPLTLQGNVLFAELNGTRFPSARLSKAAQATLNHLLLKGYHIRFAQIRFVVAWRNQDDHDGMEYAVLLPDVYLEM